MTNNATLFDSKESSESLEAMTLIIDALKDSPEHIKKITDELKKVRASADEMGNAELADTYQSLLDRINTKEHVR